MQVTYELTPEDFWQWGLYYRRHHARLKPLYRYSLVGIVIIVCVGGMIAVLGEWLTHRQPEWELLSCSLAAMLFILPRLLPPTRARVVKYASSKQGLFHERVCSISPEWLCEKTSINESKTGWATVHAIEEDAQYISLFVSTTAAHIIPKRAFSGPHEAETFLSIARRYWEAAKSGTPAATEAEIVWPPAPRPGV